MDLNAAIIKIMVTLEEICHKYMHILPNSIYKLVLSQTSWRFRDMTFIILHKHFSVKT